MEEARGPRKRKTLRRSAPAVDCVYDERHMSRAKFSL
jgi:hypothetical protein